MSKRYIVAVDASTKEQVSKFVEFAKENHMGWWHWMNNFWLLTDSAEALDAVKVRDGVNEAFPGVNNLVIELNETGDTWAGFGPQTEDRSMFKWLHATWSKNR